MWFSFEARQTHNKSSLSKVCLHCRVKKCEVLWFSVQLSSVTMLVQLPGQLVPVWLEWKPTTDFIWNVADRDLGWPVWLYRHLTGEKLNHPKRVVEGSSKSMVYLQQEGGTE